MVSTDLKGGEPLYEEGVEGAAMGFHGKQVIHPNQLEPVHSVRKDI